VSGLAPAGNLINLHIGEKVVVGRDVTVVEEATALRSNRPAPRTQEMRRT